MSDAVTERNGIKMLSFNTRTALTSLWGRTLALASISAVGLALVAAGPAGAQPVKGTGTSKGCPVEDEHGNTTYVEVGTRIGWLVCGSDGEWHFGWLIDGRVAPDNDGGPKGVTNAAVQDAEVLTRAGTLAP